MSSNVQDQSDAHPPARKHWLVALPVGVFIALAGLFFVSLFSGDPSTIPSALIGKPVPQFELSGLSGLKDGNDVVPGFKTADLKKNGMTIVNIWASWCGPCRIEHPLLMQLKAKGRAQILGINYKDVAENARHFLGVYGNPYHKVGVDGAGRTSVDWGVYGVPETFVVDGTGKIVLKHVGPLTQAIVRDKIEPLLRQNNTKR